jgi:hypothetical protein
MTSLGSAIPEGDMLALAPVERRTDAWDADNW